MDVSEQARTWGMAAHLSGLGGYIIPLANIVVPIIILSTKGKEDPFVEDQAREAINFQITCFIYILVATISIFALIGFVLTPIAILFHLIYTVIGAVKANEGHSIRYPFCIRFLSK